MNNQNDFLNLFVCMGLRSFFFVQEFLDTGTHVSVWEMTLEYNNTENSIDANNGVVPAKSVTNSGGKNG